MLKIIKCNKWGMNNYNPPTIVFCSGPTMLTYGWSVSCEPTEPR